MEGCVLEISYVMFDRTPADWAKLCKWLDRNAPGWMLANYHSNNIENVRAGSNAMVYRPDQTVKHKIKVTAEQGVIIKLFHDDAVDVWTGEEMTVEERVVACELAEYNGYWREMPAELLGAATIAMIKRKVREISRREERANARRAYA